MTDDLRPEPTIAPNTWTHFTIERIGGTTTVHTTEIVDGVLFVAVLQYGLDGRLEQKQLTRADLVLG